MKRIRKISAMICGMFSFLSLFYSLFSIYHRPVFILWLKKDKTFTILIIRFSFTFRFIENVIINLWEQKWNRRISYIECQDFECLYLTPGSTIRIRFVVQTKNSLYSIALKIFIFYIYIYFLFAACTQKLS